MSRDLHLLAALRASLNPDLALAELRNCPTVTDDGDRISIRPIWYYLLAVEAATRRAVHIAPLPVMRASSRRSFARV